jgi:hypothetical protein
VLFHHRLLRCFCRRSFVGHLRLADRAGYPADVTDADAVTQIRELVGIGPTCWQNAQARPWGFGPYQADAEMYQRMADLCLMAGADHEQLPRWVAVGLDRAARASMPPNTGGGSTRLTRLRGQLRDRGHRA